MEAVYKTSSIHGILQNAISKKWGVPCTKELKISNFLEAWRSDRMGERSNKKEVVHICPKLHIVVTLWMGVIDFHDSARRNWIHMIPAVHSRHTHRVFIGISCSLWLKVIWPPPCLLDTCSNLISTLPLKAIVLFWRSPVWRSEQGKTVPLLPTS